jgi:hypothetical protein
MIVAGFGATVTVATGAGVTVTADVADLPSLVAVIVAVPGATPVTTPAPDTVAAAVLLEVHATVRSVTTVPFTSLTVATRVVVFPAMMLAVVGATATLATGMLVTVTAELPLLPSLVAVTVAVPEATPVTTPLDETVATPVLLDDHTTVRSSTVTPFASFTVTVKAVVCPAVTLAVAGVTATLPTGTGVTVTVAVALTFSLVAVIVAVPGAMPFTTPADVTVAT